MAVYRGAGWPPFPKKSSGEGLEEAILFPSPPVTRRDRGSLKDPLSPVQPTHLTGALS